MKYISFSKVSSPQWKTLETQKVFFGHQSVGQNIVDGLDSVVSKHPDINFNIVKTIDPKLMNDHGFYHGPVGRNFDPFSKIESFKSIIESGVGGKVDIAFMKFCFVDIGTETDVKTLFNTYRNTLSQLQKKYPEVTFVHLTVPLVLEPEGLKASAKQIIKKVLSKNNLYENTAKAEYNRLIRQEYVGKEPVFDLAGYESTYSDGKRLTYPGDTAKYEALIPEYASDVGHLNKLGQNVLAKALLSFLVTLENN